MHDHVPPPWKLLLLAVAFEGGLGLAAMAVGWLIGCPPLETFHVTPRALALGAAAGLPMLVLIVASEHVRSWPFGEVLRVADELLLPLFRRSSLIDLAVISALAGLGEEMLFRGVIQGAVARGVGGAAGPWIALAVAALLFGLAHPITAGYVLLAAGMGVYLGWLWIATGNLLVPATAHAVYDFLALVYLVQGRARRGSLSDESPPEHQLQEPVGGREEDLDPEP